MSFSNLKPHEILIKCYLLETNHLFCKIELNDVSGNFLIDSGASNSCINLDSQKKFKLEKYKKPYSAFGAGNEKFDAFKTKKAKLSYQKKFIEKLNFLLIDMEPINVALNKSENISIDGIIGADVLIKKNAVLNYKSMTLSF